MTDVILVTGHDRHLGNEGASSPSASECYFWRTWAPSLRKAIESHGHGLSCRVFHRRESVAPYNARQADLVDRLNRARPRLIVDLHFNAWQGTNTGVTCVHHPASTRGALAARTLIAAVSVAQGTKALSPLAQTESWAGTELVVLTQTEAPAVILEAFWGDNPDDHDAAVAALIAGATQQAIADAVADLLSEWA